MLDEKKRKERRTKGTLEKAIEILTDLSKWRAIDTGTDQFYAIKLGIEALKAVQQTRHKPFVFGIIKLPGETDNQPTPHRILHFNSPTIKQRGRQ